MLIDVIDTPQAFEAVRPQWEGVFEADPHAQHFISWVWLNRYLGRRRRWFILALREGVDAPYVAFFPLRLQTRRDKDGFFYDEIIMAGNYAADYTGFIAEPAFEDRAVAGFAAYLKGQNWTEIKFDYFGGPPSRRIALIKALQGPEVMFRDSKRSSPHNIDNCICPVITLPETWETYLEQHMSAQSRQKLRRFLRKVEDDPAYRITWATPETIDRDLDILFDFWRIRWQPQKGAEMTERLIRASREMLMDCFADGNLDVPVLWHEDRPLGALANIIDRQKKTVLFYITGRDEEWKLPSPGLVLHGTCIRRAIGEGFRFYDFLRGNEPYKYMFGVEERPISCTLFRTRDGRNLGGVLNPRSIRHVYEMSLDHYHTGKKADAEIGFRQILQSAPAHRGAEFGLANLMFEKGDLAAAEASYRSLVPRLADPAPVLVRLGDVLLATGRNGEAAEAFHDICRTAPGHREARYKWGVALVAEKRFNDAAAVLEPLVALPSAEDSGRRYAEKARALILRIAPALTPTAPRVFKAATPAFLSPEVFSQSPVPLPV
ncbi:CelD/BcsL family acetyltransferase involved in cellulose biosynthesis [Ciceribacter lividus]|uniref:CelD/BcsL family acetyltransferase involved in cellulose biosynthesis n=1 Tax=Ciceribacter lividus TaxID=1197950 RepID=A0A6I7HI56_9HYPH|nr:GNAT family N-acetyltransferase [Ciceribacter lividus]RCW21155.1 CelD/BcsL family acetyltransferase involved in cellulose biosynthesis [Ciceribacter lividus]